MEDSKLYSTQDIGELKQKIETYKDALTSLKMGTSIEDYLFMKMDFDEIKTQVALLEGMTETIDDRQSSQIRSYEEQIKLLSAQIESLNQAIEEMNQEILKVLNKLLTIENTEAPTTPPKTEKTSKFISYGAQRDSIITQTTSQSDITSKQPSYKMLQSLAGKATNAQLDVNDGTPPAHIRNQRDLSEERHFNQQYFQSINTHPSQIYNGLFRNTTTESTFHFKNATDAQEIPVSIYEPTLPPDDASTPENYREINNAVTVDEMNSEITNEPVILDIAETVHAPAIPETVETVTAPVIPEAADTVTAPAIPEAADTVTAPVIPEAADTHNAPIIPEAANTVTAPTIPEAADTDNAPVIPEAADTDNAPVIPEAANTVTAPVIPEAANTVTAPVIPEAANTVTAPVIPETAKVNGQEDTSKSPILKSDECEIFEPQLGELYETHAQIVEVNKQPELKEESPEESQKKEKGSLFFNFFRKWS